MASKEADMTHPVWKGRESELRPVCNPGVSDSANLDRVAELLVQSERPVAETMMLLVPEAYRNHPELDATYPEAGPHCRVVHTPYTPPIHPLKPPIHPFYTPCSSPIHPLYTPCAPPIQPLPPLLLSVATSAFPHTPSRTTSTSRSPFRLEFIAIF